MSTKIEWVRNPDGTPGETWNPVVGCSKVSAGCQHCYAERWRSCTE
jgi:protein gp37